MSETDVRAYRPGDEHGILAMYRSVFGLDHSVETWRWLYERFPHGPAIIVVAENNGELVGHYAVQPRPFSFGGEDTLAGLVLGTMIEQKARNVTLLIEMAKLAYKLCADRGLRFLYAFPREEVMRVRQMLLSWQTLAMIVEWEGPLPQLPASPTPRAVPRRYSLIEKPSERLDRPQMIDPSMIYSLRDAAWLKWRIFDNPLVQYDVHAIGDANQPVAYAVTKLCYREDVLYGHIVDWHGEINDPSVREDLLAGIWRRFAERNVERFSCWANRQNSLGKALQKAGYKEQGQSTSWGFRSLGSTATEWLANRDAWHVLMADSDTY